VRREERSGEETDSKRPRGGRDEKIEKTISSPKVTSIKESTSSTQPKRVVHVVKKPPQ